MRNLFINTAVASLALVALSCKKKLDVDIVSLNKPGEEFYYGEKVPVWASTNGEKEGISYEWSATGGTFDGWRTQNLFENLWIAPTKPGEYTVTAKAKNTGSNSSKSTVMKVTRYFFDDFQSPYTKSGTGWSFTNIHDTGQALISLPNPADSRLELEATSTSAPRINRNLNLAPLKIPFSIKTVLGWKTYIRNNQAFTINLLFSAPAATTVPYIREIRWEFWPGVNPGTTDNFQLRFETYIPSTNVSKFSVKNAVFPDPGALADPVKGRYPALQSADGQLKALSFSIDADNVFHAYVDGNLWFTSNGIKDWLAQAKAAYPNFQDPMPREFRVGFPAKEANKDGTILIMKSVYINDDGQILK
ncbi:hypothetical protein HHL16_23330 [Pseudoflavitalea sp. G-6-1-2]|uniref:PKD domain-containing protein n=1 Tax=Pseudoflavitalea sp. G-6-1-2 TaxID=2728841 RepID=UPI00146A5E37|nr:PKD domain-containing protein [Pseudoflavitalea sp. G-6-1-2]NML23832.1 hypothetical protein [Pseudoflavitalea sp. G-6-1-2]